MIIEARRPFDFYLGDDIPEWESFEVSSVGALLAVQFDAKKPTHFVMVQQADQPDNPWGIPAGRVEREDNSPEDAALREIQQEVGINLSAERLIPAELSVTRRDVLPNRGIVWFRSIIRADEIPNAPESLDQYASIKIEPGPTVDRSEILKIGLIPIPYVLTRIISPGDFQPIYRPEYTKSALRQLLKG